MTPISFLTTQEYSAIGNRRLRSIVLRLLSPDFAFDTLRSLITPHDQRSICRRPVRSRSPSSSTVTMPSRRCSRRWHHASQGGFPGPLQQRLAGRSVHTLLEQMLSVHRKVRTDIENLNSVRPATRLELYHRAHQARDYMEAKSDPSPATRRSPAMLSFAPPFPCVPSRQVFGRRLHTSI